MTEFVIQPAPQASVAVAGSQARFPIRRVFCVGRNYAAHAREMGKDPDREPPFFFTKPADAVVAAEGAVPYPPLTENLHHEVELVVAIGKGGANVSPAQALDLVWGYAVGVDMTRRDLQDVAKKMSRPWDWSKAFDASGPSGPLHPVSAVGHPAKGAIWLKVNGEVRQQGDLDELIWPVADVIAYISESVTLAPGDVIFTGTPAGVGALQPGDVVTAGVEGLGEIAFTVGKR
ncbi:fumarylpyruvate hydrolase [Cupriavidus sp. YR651]|uniref:fumarylacetoacetate hydrolase family protein n=1 Tax=Cupriavidus sp. YR651 TaxID=1855315 RepID=UPI000881E64F|nr:fumarylacetoacetate hydrolase family protein [Cupriavidus sp. YR651]SDC91271.1 fumarylpyruvate hydrolase [Cupriavidus sp. YR651]